MKIALFVPSWPPGSVPNGIVTYASELVPALRRLGHDVYVLTPLASPDRDRWTIDLQPYLSRTTALTRIMFRLAQEAACFKWASAAIVEPLRELVQSGKIDVFEMEESFGYSLAVSRLKLLPVVVRLHGPWFLTAPAADSEERGLAYRRRLQREGKAVQDAHLVTSPSAKALERVEEYYGFRLVASRVIRNPLKALHESEAWNVKTCPPNSLLFVGRFDELKGGDLVLRAFAEMAEVNPGLTLTFVGPDTGIKGADGTLWTFNRFLRSTLPESCLSRVVFRGQVKASEVSLLRQRSFVTIVASRHEMMPYSILEAMSAGCPIVATAVGGIPELIKDHKNGLLVPSQNAKAIAAACQTLLSDPNLALRLGKQAWRDCRDLYAPEVIAGQTITAYHEAIKMFRK
jgi:glycosyltransferase involved in cell wall biosynthesis